VIIKKEKEEGVREISPPREDKKTIDEQKKGIA
jgi:hypothetical protein